MPVLFRKSWLRAVLLGCWVALAAGCLPQENDKPANQTAAGSDAAQNASAQAAAEQEEAVIGDLGGSRCGCRAMWIWCSMTIRRALIWSGCGITARPSARLIPS